MSDIQYARAEDGTHVAYQVLDAESGADSDRDIVVVSGGIIPLELFQDEPGFVRMLDGLCTLGRVIVFDRRGIGLSDPITDWERPIPEQWTEDLTAVVEGVCAGEVVIFAWDGFGVATRFAARHPERVRSLVLYEPLVAADDRWDEFAKHRVDMVTGILEGAPDILHWVASTRASDPAFLEWYARAGRSGASPATARRMWESVLTPRPSDQLFTSVAAPILVLHRRDNEWVTTANLMSFDGLQAPNVTLVELDGHDHFPFVDDVDALVAEIADFVVGEHRLPPPQRLLAAVMFTDLVDSTARAAAMGDARWKMMLDRHDAAIRRAVGRSGGTVVKTTGDGVLAVFPSASTAVRAAMGLSDQLAADDLEVRAGVHVGDIDRRGSDVSGLAVNIAARVMAAAGANEVFVTASVVASLAGQQVTFAPIDSRELKGVPGTWELFQALEG